MVEAGRLCESKKGGMEKFGVQLRVAPCISIGEAPVMLG